MSSKPQASKTAAGVLTPEQAVAKYQAQAAAQPTAANYLMGRGVLDT